MARKGKAGLDRDASAMSIADQSQPPARDSVTQTGGPISGSGTRPNDPKR